MRIRQTDRTVRCAAALALFASLAFDLAGCGGGGSNNGHTQSPSATSTTAGSGSNGNSSGQNPRQVLATIKGESGIVITINSAQRQTGGFVTVNGTVKNSGSDPFTGASQWRGDEEALQINGGSLAGATLVDPQGKKRYYVLRDTDGRCLCTTGLDIIQAGATLTVFAQFPAPPTSTTQVDFEVPTLPSATIPISG